jgi:hypothetical protein
MSAQLDHRLAREYPKFESKDLLWQEALVELIGSADIFASSQRSARSHASALTMRRSAMISFSASFEEAAVSP